MVIKLLRQFYQQLPRLWTLWANWSADATLEEDSNADCYADCYTDCYTHSYTDCYTDSYLDSYADSSTYIFSLVLVGKLDRN